MRRSSKTTISPSLTSVVSAVSRFPAGPVSTPYASSARPSVKLCWRMTRPGIRFGSVEVASTFWPEAGSKGRIDPRTLIAGNKTVALLIRTSSWSSTGVPSAFLAFGSYLTSMPSAEMSTTFGIFTSRPATRRLNLPVAPMSKLPARMPNASTFRSNMPRMPTRSAVIALLPWPPPNERLARSTPTAIVRMTLPSSKPKSAIEMLGPWRLSGPSVTGPPAAAPPGAEASSVNVCFRPFALTVVPARKRPGRNSTVTAPGWNTSTVFVVSRSLKKYRYVAEPVPWPEIAIGTPPIRIGSPAPFTARSATPGPTSLNCAPIEVRKLWSIVCAGSRLRYVMSM